MRGKRGFTLIELLVVISIIGLLASVVLISVNSARAKARDSKRKADLAQLNKALQLFFDDKKTMPNNYLPGLGACESEWTLGSAAAWRSAMQELVDDKVLASIPRSPNGQDYCYYNYGPGNSIGALLVTTLETETANASGTPPSCRPWPPNTNWCNQGLNNYYCLCAPY